MVQTLQLNIIPFTAPIQEAEFAFYKTKQDGYFPIFKNDLEGLLDDKFTSLELLELDKLYTDFQPPKEGALVIKINLSDTPRFANHYYRFKIRQYFESVADIISQNFTSETEVWFHNPKISNPKFKVYNQFT